jgi:hypothetical protein
MNEELQAFYDRLERHDWFYHYSDDNKVYNAGREADSKLKEYAREKGSDFKNLMTDYQNYLFSGSLYGTEKKPKPERPGGPRQADTGPF